MDRKFTPEEIEQIKRAVITHLDKKTIIDVLKANGDIEISLPYQNQMAVVPANEIYKYRPDMNMNKEQKVNTMKKKKVPESNENEKVDLKALKMTLDQFDTMEIMLMLHDSLNEKSDTGLPSVPVKETTEYLIKKRLKDIVHMFYEYIDSVMDEDDDDEEYAEYLDDDEDDDDEDEDDEDIQNDNLPPSPVPAGFFNSMAGFFGMMPMKIQQVRQRDILDLPFEEIYASDELTDAYMKDARVTNEMRSIFRIKGYLYDLRCVRKIPELRELFQSQLNLLEAHKKMVLVHFDFYKENQLSNMLYSEVVTNRFTRDYIDEKTMLPKKRYYKMTHTSFIDKAVAVDKWEYPIRDISIPTLYRSLKQKKEYPPRKNFHPFLVFIVKRHIVTIEDRKHRIVMKKEFNVLEVGILDAESRSVQKKSVDQQKH